MRWIALLLLLACAGCQKEIREVREPAGLNFIAEKGHSGSWQAIFG